MYAQVVFNLPLDQPFSYVVPDALEGRVAIGHLVQVPFRTATEYAIVVELTEKTPPYTTKPILTLVDQLPVVTQREIELAMWLSKTCAAPPGMCLWLWLPPGLTTHSDILVSIASEEGGKTPLERELIALLKRRGALRGRQLDFALAGDPWRQALDDLVKAGILKKESVLAPPRVKPRVIETAMLAIHPRHIDSAVEVMSRPSKVADLLEVLADAKGKRIELKKALKSSGANKTHASALVERGLAGIDDQERIAMTMWAEDVPAMLADMRKIDKPLRVLRVLARQNMPIDVSWLYAQTGANISDLRRMEEADLIILGEKKTYRDSLADSNFLPTAPPPLTAAQTAVFNEISAAMNNGAAHTFLLHGVTGSGKTEIYLRAIEIALMQGKNALFLVPEIALTPQTVRRVAGRFPGQVAVVHSGLTETERYDTWRRAREGLLQIIVGARSALYTPLQNIGVIILDEEHDASYKHSPPLLPPYYDSRHVAEAIAARDNAIVLLGSATPDVETMFRADRKEITRLALPNRIMGHRQRISEQAKEAGVRTQYSAADDEALTIELPSVQIVDMRAELRTGNTRIFSRVLHEELEKTLARGEQAILFLNRRGQATYVFCRDCGYVVRCPRCDTPLTYHRHGQALRCHRCDHAEPEPEICPRCHSRRIKYFGAGTQQVEQAVIETFPRARILRWDADTASTQASHDAILQRFMHRQADVLIGTQMIAKGLDLPMVTLVGVVSADVGLNLPDFRAGERTFQVLTQVAGRAGRGLLGGQVILQTYAPEHYAIQAAARHDYEAFYNREIAYRREIAYPPFRHLIRILFRYPSETQAKAEAERAANVIRKQMEKLKMTGTELIGPAPCFFTRESDMVRWHLLLRGPNPLPAVQGISVPQGWYVDVNPLEVL